MTTRGPILALLLIASLAFAAFPAALGLAAPQVVSPTGATLNVDVGKGLIVKLDRPCTSVFVADPTTADVQLKSPSVLYIMGKSAGETTIYALDQSDNVLLNTRVNVHQDVNRLQREIDQVVPGSAVEAKSVNDSIVLTGMVKTAAEGDDIRKLAARYVAGPANLVDKLTLVEPNQINLQVRIAEVDRNVLKQFGVNWENVASGVTNAGAIAGGIVSAGTSIIGNQSPTSAKVVPLLPGEALSSTTGAFGFNTQDSTLIGNATNNNFFAGLSNHNVNVNVLVDALEQHGLITVLAEPNLTTVSGQKASFLAGGEIPVPVPQTGASGSGTAITIDWKQYGISLSFTPTMLAANRIAMHVAPEVSQLDPAHGVTIDGVAVPGLTTRQADTTVELGSGQSFVIAGLLQNMTQQQIQAYPWLGDLPILGALFRSTAFQRGESELVIIVTPYVVAPVSVANALQTGMEKFEAPTDAERILHGDLVHVPALGDPAAAAPAASSRAPATTSTGLFAPQPTPAGASGFEID